MAGVKKILMYDVNYASTLFLMDDATVMACGNNEKGQLGLGNAVKNASAPTLIPNIEEVEDIFIFESFGYGYPATFFLLKNGTVKACGTNSKTVGTLGMGDNVDCVYTPTAVNGVSNVQKITGNKYGTFFILKDGQVKVCGRNLNGAFGLGDTQERSTPVLIPGVSNIVNVYAPLNLPVILVSADGSLKQLNTGTHLFEECTKLTDVKEVYYPFQDYAYGSALHFILKEKTVVAQGYGDYLGTAQPPTTNFLPVQNVSDVKQVAGASTTFYFLKEDGSVMACGDNTYGQLGFGDTTARSVPELIPNLVGVKKIFAKSSANVFFLMNDGSVKGCGTNGNGALGLGAEIKISLPTTIPGLTDVVDIQRPTGSAFTTMFLMADGSVKSLGIDKGGNLGLGYYVSTNKPISIPTFSTLHYLYLKGDICYAEENKSLLQIATNWSALAATEKKALFDSATSEMPSISSLSDLGAFKVVAFKEGTAAMNAPTCRLTAIATDCLVTPKGLIPIRNFEGIDKATLTITTSGQGSCKVLVTTDRTAYQSYDFATQAWKVVDHTDLAAVKADGIDAAQLTNIPRAAWDTLTAGKDGIGFAYLPSIESTSDVCSVDELTLQVDMRGIWERATEADYTYAYPNNTTLRVTLKTDGDYKINYQA